MKKWMGATISTVLTCGFATWYTWPDLAEITRLRDKPSAAVVATEPLHISAYEWQMQRVHETRKATTRMIECTSEIWERLNSRGPICKDACGQYWEIYRKEINAPQWAEWDQADTIQRPDDSICKRFRPKDIS